MTAPLVPSPRIAALAGRGGMAVGLVVLLGWWLELDVVRRVVPDGTAMNPLTAVLFVLLGGALWLAHDERPVCRRLRRLLAVSALGVATLVAGDHLFGLGLRADRVLFAETLRTLQDAVPNRMSLNAAVAFMLLGLALLLGGRRAQRMVLLSQAMALVAAWIGLVAIIGYFYRIPVHSPYGGYLPMALHTGVTLVLLAAGMLMLHPARGLMSVLFRADPGGQLARRLMPPFILLPIAFGYVALAGEQHGLFDINVGQALLVSSLIASSMALLWGLAVSFSRASRARAQVESRLRRSEALLAEAQKLAHLGSWEHDPATGAMTWSDELCRLLGLTPGALAPSVEALLAHVHPDDRAALERSLRLGEPFRRHLRIVRPDDQVRVLAVRHEGLTDPIAPSLRFVGVAQDVTERQAVERMKDEFVSVVSHELRTPLTAIRGALGLLETGRLGQLSERGQDMLAMAARNSERLVRLIGDILDVERMAAGVVVVEPQPARVRDVLRQAVEAMAPLAHKAGVSLEVADSDLAVRADPDRLQQVLTNLIDNAIKFSPRGSTVRLGARQTDGELAFAIADRGRGIPPDRLESIFERFGQVDASDSRQKGGTGLGLTICRSIVQLHGGRIWAESTLGEGSTFTFTLPAAPGG